MSARAEILSRVREAVAGAAPVEVDRDYRRSGAGEDVAGLFAERVADYRASVWRVESGGVRDALGEACREAGAGRLAVPPDLPEGWAPDGVELVPAEGLGPHELDGFDGALTGCAAAIAETGTIVLDGGPRQGRRAMTLVPDYHLCVVEERQVAEIVPQAVERLGEAVRAGRPLTFVSGPSATSDIELNRVEGVHGPRTLHVVLVAG